MPARVRDPGRRPRPRASARASDVAGARVDALNASVFADLLAKLISRLPGATAAVLVDDEGEAVDAVVVRPRRSTPAAARTSTSRRASAAVRAALRTPPRPPAHASPDVDAVRIAGAHWQIALREVAAAPARAIGPLGALAVRAARRTYLVRALPAAHVLVVVGTARVAASAFARPLDACARAVSLEAGWTLPVASSFVWQWVDVDVDRRGTPTHARVDATAPPLPLEILGAVVGLNPHEIGFRVRLDSGAELTLVGEPRRASPASATRDWYVDIAPAAVFPMSLRPPSTK